MTVLGGVVVSYNKGNPVKHPDNISLGQSIKHEHRRHFLQISDRTPLPSPFTLKSECSTPGERIFIELMTSDRELEASGEGSK